MRWSRSEKPRPAAWPLSLPGSPAPERVEEIKRRTEEIAARSQYGWGHTIDFGPFKQEGLLGEKYLDIVGRWDQLGWLPGSLKGIRAADIGCFTGGISLILAHRGAEDVLAVDEVPEHVEQCAYVAEVFEASTVRATKASLFELPELVAPGSLDLIVLAGVLYHLSDMLVGLYLLRKLLKVGGSLLMESYAVEDEEHSYANFGRFAMGVWWQPSILCLKDMCRFMGFSNVEVEMYLPDRCLARARKSSDEEIPFRRGLNYRFEDIHDAVSRTMDVETMAPK